MRRVQQELKYFRLIVNKGEYTLLFFFSVDEKREEKKAGEKK